MDVISRAAAIAELMQMVKAHEHEIFRGELLHYTGIKAMLEAQPAVAAVPVVRCKDCKHRPIENEFPDECCPCQCEDYWYSWYPDDDWFCASGKRRDDDALSGR